MDERELMLTSVLNCRRVDLYARDLRLSPEQEKEFAGMRACRERGMPLQYILGETEFCGLSFLVNAHVLIPRPETEMMAEHLIQKFTKKRARPLKILEIGTGSGCLAVSLVRRIPDARCRAVDISAEALAVARRNAERHHVEDRIDFEQADGLESWHRIFSDEYDVVVSNPPYIRTADVDTLPPDVRQEPAVALDGGPDGLTFYRHFFTEAPRVLGPGGFMACEFGDGQDEALRKMAGASWSIEFFRDLSGVLRFFIAQYCPSLHGGS